MSDPEPVQHLGADQHAADAERRPELQHIHAQPAAELVLGQHAVHHLLGALLGIGHE